MPKVQLPAWKRKHKPKKQKRIFAFIDSQNLNVGTQRVGWKMDWKKFRHFLHDKYGVTEAFMFIGYMPEFEDLYLQMHEAGYKVVLKTTYDMTRPHPEMQPDSEKKAATETSSKKKDEGEDAEKHIKGNIDADLVLWAMKEMKNYDKAILVSGDGDFYSLVEYLDQEHKLQHILTPNQFYSNLYNSYDPYIVQLGKHKKELAYRTKKHHRKKQNKKNT